jgi:ATP-dependent protease Clp ATPase subunit
MGSGVGEEEVEEEEEGIVNRDEVSKAVRSSDSSSII